jgi:Flp pilus assembly protein TadD
MATTDVQPERSPAQPAPRTGISTLSRLAAIAVAACCVVAGIYLLGAQRQAAHLQDARDLARAGQYAAAARAAAGISGASATAATGVAAEALARGGGGPTADRAFARAVRGDPTDWTLWRDWAVLLYADGQRARARHQMEVASWLNPRIVVPPAFYFR